MDKISITTLVVALSTFLCASADCHSASTIEFKAAIARVEGDISIWPVALAIGDPIEVLLSPATGPTAKYASESNRELAVTMPGAEIVAPWYNVSFGGLVSNDPPGAGIGVGCTSQTDSEGCTMGGLLDERFIGLTAELALLGNTGLVPPPGYLESADVWNSLDRLREFRIHAWEGMGEIGQPILTITGTVGVVSISLPEPSTLALLATIAAATLRRRRL